MATEPVDIIARLGVDSTGVVQELDKVNAKYAESNKELKKTQEQIATLQREEQALIAQRAKTNSPTIIAQFNNELKKNKDQLDKLIATEKLLSKETADVGKQGLKTKKDLDNAFDVTKTTSLRSQIRKLREDLANATDPAEIERLAKETGALTDRMEDAAQAARVFSSESKFEQIGTAFGGVLGKLRNLDFKGALDQSRLLVATSKSLTFKEALSGVKDLGGTLLNIGKSLLLNPIFLIGAAVTLIISNFDKLKSSGGLIGKLFTGIGDSINFVIDGFTRLTDAIGLTSLAAEKFSASIVANNNKAIASITSRYDTEIRLAKAAGKETTEIEKQKFIELAKINKANADVLKRKTGLTDDEKSALKDSIDAERESNLRIIEITAEARKKREDEQKKASEKAKAERDKESKERLEQLRKAQGAYEAILLSDKEKLDKLLAEIDAANDKRIAAQAAELNERQRHVLAMEQIQGLSEAVRLADEIKFEEERLANVKFYNGEFSQEFINQSNKIIELKEKQKQEILKLDEEEKEQLKAALKDLYKSAKTAADQILAAKIHELDGQTAAQEKRVEEATKIAEKGNSQLLELEKKRLDDLNKEKEKFVRAQQALAAIELISETAVMVAKAGAEGGAAAAVTIAAAIIALIAGLASARSIAGQAAFYEGGEGYTGDGNVRGESLLLGRKDYTYHNREFIFNNQTTSKYIDHFRNIHTGKMDLDQVVHHAKLYDMMKMNNIDMTREVRIRPISDANNINDLKVSMKAVEKAIKGQERTKVIFDSNGIAIIATNYIERENRLNKLAS